MSRKRGPKRRIGRPPKHGAYSLAIQDALLKKNPRVTRYLVDTRAGLVRCVGGSEDALSEQQRLMIDRIISKLAICRLIELYVERYGAFPQRRVKGKTIVRLELVPCLGVNYLAFSNSIDRALVALGLTKKEADKVLSPLEIAAEIDAEEAAAQAAKAKETAACGAGAAQEGRSATDQGDGKVTIRADPGDNGQESSERAPEINGDGQSEGAGQGDGPDAGVAED